MQSNTTWLVVNAASGSNGDDSVETLSCALASAGREPARVFNLQADALPTRGEVDAAGVSLLVVFGGDGSANAVVRALEGWAGEILVLPGGTANLLARALHGEADAESIIALLGTGQLASVRRTCIRCAGTAALIEVLAGPGATWSDVREDLRDGGAIAAAGSAIAATRESANGAAVRIVEPPLGREEGYPGVRMAPDGPHIIVDGYGPQSIVDFVKQGVALLRRDFREGPHDELGEYPELLCHSIDRSPIELMIDGERVTGGAEEKFSISPLEVNLLAAFHG